MPLSQLFGGSVCLRLAAVGAELYPPGRERLWEVTMGSLAVGAVVAVGSGAGGSSRSEFPREEGGRPGHEALE